MKEEKWKSNQRGDNFKMWIIRISSSSLLFYIHSSSFSSSHFVFFSPLNALKFYGSEKYSYIQHPLLSWYKIGGRVINNSTSNSFLSFLSTKPLDSIFCTFLKLNERNKKKKISKRINEEWEKVRKKALFLRRCAFFSVDLRTSFFSIENYII